MNLQFKNLQQLLDHFKDEETCRAYYEQVRWGGNVACIHCGSLHVYRTNRGFKCGEKECYKKFSLTVGSIFENTKIPLRTWFTAIYLMTISKKGISSIQLADQIGVTQKTAWFILSRIRTMVGEENTDGHVGGGGQLVEIDETYVGGKMKNMSKSKRKAHVEGKTHSQMNKTPVMGFLVRGGTLRLRVIADRTEIRHSVKENVSTDSVVITDTSAMYSTLKNNYLSHQSVDHSRDEYVKDKTIHTNTVEGAFSLFDRMVIGIYHYISPKHMQRYCNEFIYRYNRRKNTGMERFEMALDKVSSTRITYPELIGKS